MYRKMFRAPRKPVRGFRPRVNRVTPGIPHARANDTACRGLRERERWKTNSEQPQPSSYVGFKDIIFLFPLRSTYTLTEGCGVKYSQFIFHNQKNRDIFNHCVRKTEFGLAQIMSCTCKQQNMSTVKPGGPVLILSDVS